MKINRILLKIAYFLSTTTNQVSAKPRIRRLPRDTQKNQNQVHAITWNGFGF